MALKALARHADTGGGNGILTPGDLRHGGFRSCAEGPHVTQHQGAIASRGPT